MHIIIHNNQCFNVDNTVDVTRLLEQGARELTPDEIRQYGMAGYEQYVSPVDTVVNADGTVTFTPPDVEAAREEKRQAINRAYEAALAASLTMPSVTAPPSPTEVAVNAAAWAADDAEGYAELLAIHAARRRELLAAVAAAQTAAEVEAVPVTFNV